MESEVNSILVTAHELKAPLTTLRQLALSLDFSDPTDCESIREDMINISDRTIRQINDLTKIARLEDGLFDMEPVSIRGVCEDVTRNLSYLFHYNNRNLYTHYSNKSRLVLANPELLYSVVYNFCLNAMHYSTEETLSELFVSDRRGKVRFCVRDYGPALPADVAREIRRGFIERPTSISMRPGSSGLGLFIASRFSQYMHANIGTIRHRDGTSFFVDLPVSRQASLF